MKTLVLLLAAITLTLTGCATDYGAYTKAVAAQQAATEATKTAKLDALRNLGCSTTKLYHEGKHVGTESKCDPETQKFAAFALAVSGMQTAQEQIARIEAPYTMREALRDVAGLVVPLANVGAQIYGIQKNAAVAITQSNNSAAVAMNTNNTMAGIATGGFNAAAGIATSGFTAATTLGNRPTTVINGDGNAVNGSTLTKTTTTTTTSTNNCASGNGGSGTPGGTDTTSTSASTSTGTQGAPSGATNCGAGK